MDRSRRGGEKGRYAAIGEEDSPEYVISLGEDIVMAKGVGDQLKKYEDTIADIKDKWCLGVHKGCKLEEICKFYKGND